MSSICVTPPPLTAADALFLDFDGTLAPIQRDPDTVQLPSGLADILSALKHRFAGAIAIVSGRDLDDLSQRVPTEFWRYGNHGLRVAGPGQTKSAMPSPAPDEMVEQIRSALAAHAGARLERKGPVLAVHYREVPTAGEALLHAMRTIIAAFDGYSVQHGKMVLEAKPKSANKGVALQKAMMEAPFAGRRPVMIGDDTTDEDAFSAALALGGLAIKVGEGDSVAPYRLASPGDVHQFLRECIAE